MTIRLVIAALALFTSSFGVAAAQATVADRACEREMAAASTKYAVPLGVLYAVGLTESGHKDSLQRNAMNIEGQPYFATSVVEGLRRFDDARAAGKILIDIGCMQINHHFHGGEFSSVEQMFDPHANVDYAARFLKVLHRREGSWTMAVARYHAGPNNNPAQKQYVCAVIVNMVATGFGEWTAQSRDFCR
jgi:soluble lytic murein transglycosylase-like protein